MNKISHKNIIFADKQQSLVTIHSYKRTYASKLGLVPVAGLGPARSLRQWISSNSLFDLAIVILTLFISSYIKSAFHAMAFLKLIKIPYRELRFNRFNIGICRIVPVPAKRTEFLCFKICPFHKTIPFNFYRDIKYGGTGIFSPVLQFKYFSFAHSTNMPLPVLTREKKFGSGIVTFVRFSHPPKTP